MQIKISRQAEKDIENLDHKTRAKVYKKLYDLENRKINYSKYKSKENVFKIESGKYRIVFEVDKQSGTILVTKVKLRKIVYRNI
jgi:mRNA-degrading endonuclease RelE of RelBE toxin-antitoxin system